MICNKCGTECPDGNIFCEACGCELEAPVLPENIDDKGRVKKKKEKKNEAAAKKEKKERRQRSDEEKASMKKKIKGAVICLAVIAVIVLIAVIISMINSGAGYKAAQKIPLGRNLPYVESETGLTFAKKSTNGMINNLSEFDYICISEETTKVSGSEQPKWAILLTCSDDDIITDVEYYDFTQLKLNWKGRKMAEMLDQNTLEYGMNIKNVNKTLGLKPYYIKRSLSNDSVYCYRYYYTDTDEGYDRAYNYFVKFSEIELSVKDVSFNEIDYAGTILAATSSSYRSDADVVYSDEMNSQSTDEGEADNTSETSDENNDE